MKRTPLQQFADAFYTVSLILVDAYPGTWQIWTRRRLALLASAGVLTAGANAFSAYRVHSIPRSNHTLYVGLRTEKPPRLLEQRIRDYWNTANWTKESETLTHAFLRAIEQHDRTRALALGEQLCQKFRPIEYSKEDGEWYLHAVLGEAYLEQGWLDDATTEFHAVLAHIPPGRPNWGTSPARETAVYGLTRILSFQGSYTEALQRLTQAPGENNNGCGNANEDERVDNYPKQVVWKIARKPFPVAEHELQAIMVGHFIPMASTINGDTTEDQRLHAAAEAALTLGCLYYQAGKKDDARICWQLVADHALAEQQDRILAEALLCHHGFRTKI